jgi:hypothetical protein
MNPTTAKGRKRPKFRVGQRVVLKRNNKIVHLRKRNEVLPKLWFYCSDGYLHRITDLRPLTRREAGTR